MPISARNQSGFGSVVLVVMILVLVVSIGYISFQIRKPTFEVSKAYEGGAAAGIDTFNFDAIIQTGLEVIQNVIDNQISDANRTLSNPNSSQAAKDQAKSVKDQREKDQVDLNQKFGKVEIKNGKPDYTERNLRITQQWDEANRLGVAPPRNGFQVDVQNHTPINDNSSNNARASLAGAAAAGALRK